jgi:hypothetical protein
MHFGTWYTFSPQKTDHWGSDQFFVFFFGVNEKWTVQVYDTKLMT